MGQYFSPATSQYEQRAFAQVTGAHDGNDLSTFGIDIASTCPGGNNAACAFTRTVVPSIPEPETYALMLAGLGLVVGVARKRRAHAAA